MKKRRSKRTKEMQARRALILKQLADLIENLIDVEEDIKTELKIPRPKGLVIL